MSELYLIAHKVRGEAAFDVAKQMLCPICHGDPIYGGERGELIEICHECDSLGYWWIIPTSGHRAYPYWDVPIDDLRLYDGETHYGIGSETEIMNGMPEGLPDHYKHGPAPKVDIKALFQKPKGPTMKRRL